MKESNAEILISKNESRDSLAMYDVETEEENLQEFRVICSELKQKTDSKAVARKENKIEINTKVYMLRIINETQLAQREKLQ